MEWNVKQSEQRRGRGAGIGIGFSRGRGVRSARLFPRGAGPLSLGQNFSTARSVEWSRGGGALPRLRLIGAVAAALPCSLLAFPPQIIADPWLSN